MHAAFSQWAHTTLTRSAATHLLALRLFRILSLCFAHWARHSFTHSAATQLVSRRLRQVLSHAFTHWRIVAAGRRYRALQLQKIRGKLAAQPSTLCVTAERALRRWRMSSAAASAFAGWQSRAASKRAHLACIVNALQHIRHLKLRSAFHAWRGGVEYMARNQLEGIRLEGLICGDLVETTLHTWREAAQLAVQLSNSEAAADSFFFHHVAPAVCVPPQQPVRTNYPLIFCLSERNTPCIPACVSPEG